MITRTSDQHLPPPTGFAIAAVPACVMVLAVFVIFWNAPFRIEGDIAYVAKAAEQYFSVHAPYNRLRLVDPQDLSADVDTWIFWWPPFNYTAFVSLLALGLSVASAAHVLMLVTALSGSAGWAAVSSILFSNRIALLLSGIPSLIYVLNNEMFDQFASGDPIIFATVPWLFACAIICCRYPRWSSPVVLFCFGLLCGLLYWVKFSSLFVTASLIATVSIANLDKSQLRSSLARIALLGTGYILPIISLWVLNRIRGGDFLASSIASADLFENLPSAFLRAAANAVFPIDNGVQRFLSGYLVLPLLVRAASVLLAATIVVTAWRTYGRFVGLLSVLTILVPIAALGYLTWASGYHFLLDAQRHAGPYWIFLQLLLIGLVLGDGFPRGAAVRGVVVGCSLVLMAFSAFTSYVGLRGALARTGSDRDPQTGLYDPTLSLAGSGAVAESIREKLTQADVVVLASYWLGMETWLAFDQRLLPLTNFYQPLVVTHGIDGANYFGTTTFRTDKPIRVVLVLTDPFARADTAQQNERIKHRFVQAKQWIKIEIANNSTTTVWTATLDPRTD